MAIVEFILPPEEALPSMGISAWPLILGTCVLWQAVLVPRSCGLRGDTILTAAGSVDMPGRGLVLSNLILAQNQNATKMSTKRCAEYNAAHAMCNRKCEMRKCGAKCETCIQITAGRPDGRHGHMDRWMHGCMDTWIHG